MKNIRIEIKGKIIVLASGCVREAREASSDAGDAWLRIEIIGKMPRFWGIGDGFYVRDNLKTSIMNDNGCGHWRNMRVMVQEARYLGEW